MRVRNVGFFLLVLLALPLLSLAADTGSIVGIVRDQDGKPLADARVSLSGSGNSINRQTSSNGSGQFRFVGLATGDYALSAELSGYTAKASAFIHLDSSTGTASAELILLRSTPAAAFKILSKAETEIRMMQKSLANKPVTIDSLSLPRISTDTQEGQFGRGTGRRSS